MSREQATWNVAKIKSLIFEVPVKVSVPFIVRYKFEATQLNDKLTSHCKLFVWENIR